MAIKIVLALLFAVAVISIAFIQLLIKWNDDNIKESVYIGKLNDLNASLNYSNDMQQPVSFSLDYVSKSDFKNDSAFDTLCEYVSEREDYFLKAVSTAKNNLELYENYCTGYDNLAAEKSKASYNSEKRKLKEKFCNKVTNEYFINNKALAPELPSVTVNRTFLNTKKKRTETPQKTVFNFKEICLAQMLNAKSINYSEEKRFFKMFNKKESVNSLIYNVVKKNDFKCSLCENSPGDINDLHIIQLKEHEKFALNGMRVICRNCLKADDDLIV